MDSDSAHRDFSVVAKKKRSSLVSLAFPQAIRKLLQRTSDELGLLPQVGGKEAIGVGDGDEASLEGVLKSLGRTGG